MGERLKRYKVKPDIIISSPAKRAFSTAKIIAERLEVANLKTEPKLYTGTSAVYLDIITQISDEHKSVFIVGHNPTITEICENLSGKFVGNIPTCGIFCIEFDVECFSDISSSSGKKLFFDFPKKHKIFV
jgi:phosphohistidine phosphatase